MILENVISKELYDKLEYNKDEGRYKGLFIPDKIKVYQEVNENCDDFESYDKFSIKYNKFLNQFKDYKVDDFYKIKFIYCNNVFKITLTLFNLKNSDYEYIYDSDVRLFEFGVKKYIKIEDFYFFRKNEGIEKEIIDSIKKYRLPIVYDVDFLYKDDKDSIIKDQINYFESFGFENIAYTLKTDIDVMGYYEDGFTNSLLYK